MNGTTVKAVRLYLGMTQREFADETGIGVSWLSQIENGRVEPSDRIRMAIAKIFEIDGEFIEVLERSKMLI
ncbi:helix-turn-helix domain-containing protein [Salibacterium halotolerans]|uniref:DNA-binding transcriptional regulator, XRE-family HTH domain n=1 Tax=Salibacterium halotolerans TaxID=1884432 RepID=A0A1I5UVJ4_9BACI|nr:helix-turn-helix transcriptional regulator [Salibacterium halotolerans]SFP99275.1 DNA-binding transcriptional regulator, XRE-family HTH domain [Salibacterium halotolerans]